MKKWLSYILTAVLYGLFVSSCIENEGIIETDTTKVPVRLTLSFSSAGDSRSIDSPTENGNLDYTTEVQSKMDENDVFVLVFDAASDELLYQVKDLKLGGVSSSDGYYTRTLEGTLLRTTGNQEVKLVVLANLIQNNIYDEGLLLDSKNLVETFIENLKGETSTVIYRKLVYNYKGNISPWNTADRRIPMYGVTKAIEIPPSGQEVTCKLYRAVAKVSIWVNQKEGYNNFTITGITVNGANDKGYCASMNTPDSSENIQYENPSVPEGQEQQDIKYNNLSVTKAYEDEIYLLEQENTNSNEVSLSIDYIYHNVQKTGIINFKDDSNGEKFDIVRNHVYVFNIQIQEEVDAALFYTVDRWTEETIDIPTFE